MSSNMLYFLKDLGSSSHQRAKLVDWRILINAEKMYPQHARPHGMTSISPEYEYTLPVHPLPLPFQQTPLQSQQPKLQAQNPLLQRTLQTGKQFRAQYNEAQPLVLQEQTFHQEELSGVQPQLPAARSQWHVVFMYAGSLKFGPFFWLDKSLDRFCAMGSLPDSFLHFDSLK
ncbi:ameloblastin [Strix aluco]|uniref:ameloblastin n=1 Tax=Strix aluco TaxID=111821 RepID=UPI003DA37643